MTDYLVYDVFTQSPFGGNQLAIIPDATRLAEDQLQKIAREFNYSETVFIYPPAQAGHTAKVRIFTPTMEVPFAVHPIIGTLVALADLGHTSPMKLELGVGPLECSVTRGLASFTTTAALETLATPPPELVANALGLNANDIVSETHAPVQATLGLAFVIAEVSDRATLSRCVPNLDAIRMGASLHPAGLDFAIFAYCRNNQDVDARMFAPLDNIPEDPATGSASATLAALLTKQLGAAQNLTIRQGYDMGRPSDITATKRIADPIPVTISGNAVKTMEGRLVL